MNIVTMLGALKTSLIATLLTFASVFVHSIEQTPEILTRAAHCLWAKHALSMRQEQALTMAYFLDATSYPNEKVIYVLSDASAARSRGLVFTIFITEQDGCRS